jgi:hypothetical protein
MQRMHVPVTPKDRYAWTDWRTVMQLNYKLLHHTVQRIFFSLPLLFKIPALISFTFITIGHEGLYKPIYPSYRVAEVQK